MREMFTAANFLDSHTCILLEHRSFAICRTDYDTAAYRSPTTGSYNILANIVLDVLLMQEAAPALPRRDRLQKLQEAHGQQASRGKREHGCKLRETANAE